MTEKKIRCDACGAPAMEVRYNFRREISASGSSETESDSIDLCHEHAITSLQSFLKDWNNTAQALKDNFSDWAKSRTWKSNA